MEKDALKFLYNLGLEENPLVETEQGLFSKNDLIKVKQEVVRPLGVSTLTGLIDYIKFNYGKELPENTIIQVKSPSEVCLYGTLNKDCNRDFFVKVELDQRRIEFDTYLDKEEFNIMLQSQFVDNNDKKILLKYTSLMKEDSSVQLNDDGVCQTTTVKTGVATLGNAEIPNPVRLKPYRTFTEIDQPESEFIFRVKKGPYCCLIPADGRAWRNKAIIAIKEYLEKELTDFKINIIA